LEFIGHLVLVVCFFRFTRLGVNLLNHPMQTFIGFEKALDLTLSNVTVGKTETLPLRQLVGKILAEDVVARVDCPSVSSSRKDGYAVISSDVSEACRRTPVTLTVVGHLVAGSSRELKIRHGQAVRITTGAPLPDGADAVLSEEFCRRAENAIIARNTAEVGRNIHVRGRDIRRGETVAEKGRKLTPAFIGLLAAAGLDRAPVYKSPKVSVIATGDEVVLPGKPLHKGQLYASNMVTLCSWLALMGLDYTAQRVSDRKEYLEHAITTMLADVDVLISSGGAWGSERDLIFDVLQSLNWRGIYHRVRMGPGKPVGFGLVAQKPFFCLPGGPPSNEMAFLQLVIPALRKIMGDDPVLFPVTTARLAETVTGKIDWIDFVHARLEYRQNELWVYPILLKGSLQSMAVKEALIVIPEDRQSLSAGELIHIQVLVPLTEVYRKRQFVSAGRDKKMNIEHRTPNIEC
jgi:molybdopterin molybdotransferase